MIKQKNISLVMPCRNESGNLKRILKKIPFYIDEIIVVDNNSTDNSAEIATNYRKVNFFEEKKQIGGIGYGYAYKKGIKKAQGEFIVCLDADCSYPFGAIKKIINFMEKKKIDFISCNRLPLYKKCSMSKVRQLGVMILNFFFLILFGYPIKDCLSGMWIFRKTAVNYLDLDEGGWNFSLAIKLSALLNPKINFAEYHIKYQDRFTGKSKQNLIKTGFEHLYYLFFVKIQQIKNNLAGGLLKRYEAI